LNVGHPYLWLESYLQFGKIVQQGTGTIKSHGPTTPAYIPKIRAHIFLQKVFSARKVYCRLNIRTRRSMEIPTWTLVVIAAAIIGLVAFAAYFAGQASQPIG